MQKNIAIYRSIDTWLEKQYAQLGLTGLQASAIMVLLDAHKLSQSELADALGVGKSAVSKVSRKLLELGYAERRRRRKDKRLHLLCPTRKAAQLSPQLVAIQDQLEEILFSDFGKVTGRDWNTFWKESEITFRCFMGDHLSRCRHIVRTIFQTICEKSHQSNGRPCGRSILEP